MSLTLIGGETAYYEPPAEPFIECECGACEDVAICEIPGHLIQAGRDWLIAGTEYPSPESMWPAEVYAAIEECWGWERFVSDTTRRRAA